MTSTAIARISFSTALVPTLGPGSQAQARDIFGSQVSEREVPKPPMDASITAELDRGFNFMASATVSRHSRQKAEFEQSLKSARIACETAKKLLAESADERSAEFQMRLNALESIVLDASNTNLTQAAVAHG